MKIIYYDSTGQYLAVIAAAFHLNMVSVDNKVEDNQLPKRDTLEKLPYFGNQEQVKLGQIIFVGTDQLGNDIYILGSDKVGDVIERVAEGLSRIFQLEAENLFIDLTDYEDRRLKWGLKLKRIFPSLSVANRLINHSLRDSFPELLDKVNEIKKSLK